MNKVIFPRVFLRGQLGDQLSLFYFIFLIAVLTIGVSTGVYLFYGEGYDARFSNSNAMADEIEKCFKANFALHELNEIDLEVLSSACSFELKIVEDNFVLGIYRDNNLILNNGNLESCLFEGAKGNKEYPVCIERDFSLLDSSYKIIVGSKQEYTKGGR